MASLRERNGLLFFDFRYQGVRCREQTALPDTPGNRSKVQSVLDRLKREIKLGTFVYAEFFPDSPRVTQFAPDATPLTRRQILHGEGGKKMPPVFRDFSAEWLAENGVRWKLSYRVNIESIIDSYLNPAFGEYRVNAIGRGDLMKFRAGLVENDKDRQRLTNDRINHIMTPLRMIVTEAAERYGFASPAAGMKPLRVDPTDVDPFSLEEIMTVLDNVRADFRNYYAVRFFTGLRTAEVDGLQWRYVDFQKRLILVRETLVNGRKETTKTPGSVRDVWMSAIVFEALKAQYEATGRLGEYVFCNRQGQPLNHRNITTRVWYPLLRYLKMKPRKPYQTRHTAATLWLAAGENPEWIARQMGHSTTRMLFTVYSRYVPNMTRRDGSAFENLLATRLKGGTHHGE